MRRISLVLMVAAALFCGGGVGLSQQASTTGIAGGRGGNPFTDSLPAAGAIISEVRVRAGDTIDAVQMVYQMPNGQMAVGLRHGGGGGGQNTFQLESGEYIVALAGRYGDTIDSLSIVTNRRQSQIFGGRGGDRDYRLEVPAGCQAIGFTGRSGDTVDAIGLVFSQIPRRRDIFTTGQFPSGPYGMTQVAGGGGGRPFADQEIPAGATLTEIRVRAGDTIDAVQAISQLADGSYAQSTLHGGGGGRLYTFRFDPDEYLVALAGRYGDTVDSLVIITNKRQSQAFGGRGGDRDYRIEVPQGTQGVGFAGRSGDTVDAIGLIYDQMSNRRGNFYSRQVPSGNTLRGQLGQTQMAGGGSGRNFADQDFPAGAKIAEVRVRAGDSIEAIQAVYVTPDGRYVESTLHGGGGRGYGVLGARGNRGRFSTFRFDSDEYLVALAGRCGDTVNSLTIITNKRQSQVFGGSGGTRNFRIEVPQGSQAVGFFGRAGNGIDAIGLVYARVGSRR